MIGLDTNILLRYLLEDDPVQSARAERLMESTFTHADPGFVSLVTITETAWVLGSVYRFTGREVASAIESILDMGVLDVQNKPQVYEAMIALQSGQADFADALIAAVGTWAGCTTTLTFDKKASRLPGFQLL